MQNEEIYDAQLVYEPPSTRSRRLWPALGCGGLVALVLLLMIGTAVWQITAGVRQAATRVQQVSRSDPQSRLAKQAELWRAFSASAPAVSGADLRSIEALFDRLVLAADSPDEQAFRDAVDARRLVSEMAAFSQAGSILRLLERPIALEVAGNVALPWQIARYRLVDVRRLEGGAEALVYGWFWDHEDDPAEMRWWVVKQRDGQWKAYDWELLQVGLREAVERAYLTDAPEAASSRFSAVFDCLQAAQEIPRYDGEAYAAAMGRAQQAASRVTGEMRDAAQVYVALYWHWRGEHGPAAEAARRVEFPDAAPGAYLVLMEQALAEEQFEQALAWADQLEAALGRSPNALEGRAAACEGLGRAEQATPLWRELLALDPQHQEAAQAVAQRLGRASQETIRQWAAALPGEALGPIAENLADDARVQALETLSQAMRSGDPETFEHLYYTARAQELRLQDEQAAELAQRALALTDDDVLRSQTLELYFRAMRSLGRNLQAYREAPDAEEAFQWLLGDDPDEPPVREGAELDAVLTAHAERVPDDPWLFLRRAQRQRQQGLGQEALVSFATALGLVQRYADREDAPWLQEALRSQRLETLIESGQWRLAYDEAVVRGSPDGEPAWFAVAEALDDHRQYSALAELASLRLQSAPQDPLTWLYQGVASSAEGDYAAAEELFWRAAAELGEDDFACWTAPYYRTVNFIRSRDWEQALTEPVAAGGSQPSLDMLERLTRQLQSAGRWDELAALLQAAATAGWHSDQADRAESLQRYAQAQLDYHRCDYASVAGLLAEVAAAWRGELLSYERTAFDEMVFRSVLRHNGESAALNAADVLWADDDDQRRRYRFVAVVAEGDPAETARWIQEQPTEARLWETLMVDEDAGPAMRRDAYRELRNQYPVLHYPAVGEDFVILLAQPVFPSDDELRRAATEAAGAEALVESPPAESLPEPDAEMARRKIVCGQHQFLVSWSPRRYVTADNSAADGWIDPRGKDMLEQHTAWLAIGRIASTAPDTMAENALLERLLLQLRREHWLSVYDGSRSQLVAAARIGATTGKAELPIEMYLNRDTFASPRTFQVQEYARRSSWRLRDALERQQAESVETLVNLGTENFPDVQWVRLRTAEMARYGGLDAQAVVLHDSWACPWLRAGDVIRLDDARLLDWRIAAKGQESQASDEARRWLARRVGLAAEQD